MRVSPRPGVGRAASSGGEGKQNAGRKDRQQRGGGGMHGTVPELEALHFPRQGAAVKGFAVMGSPVGAGVGFN